MVNTWRPPNLKAPKLTVAGYDPWAAWKQGQDPYAANLAAAPANATGAYTADLGGQAQGLQSPYQSPNGVGGAAADWERWQGEPQVYYSKAVTTPTSGSARDPYGRPAGHPDFGKPPGVDTVPGGDGRAGAADRAVANQAILPGGGTAGQPLVFLQDWAYGGDQLGGGKYVNGRWTHGGPVAAGTDLGTMGVAKTTGFVLPVGYDSRADTGRYELNGQVGETAWSRVLRKAQEFMQGGRTTFADAFNRALAIVNQEAAAQGKTTGFGATAAPGAASGTTPVAAAGDAAAGDAAAAAAAAGAGGGGGATGATGGATPAGGGVFPTEIEIDMARQNKDMAIQAYRKARGQTGRDKSLYGEFREGRMGDAVQALLAMIDGDPMAQANGDIGRLVAAQAAGTGIGGLLRERAAGLTNRDLSGYDDTQMLQLLGAQQAAAGFGLGPFAQFEMENRFGDLKDQAERATLDGNTAGVLANPAARQRFTDSLQRYLALR